MVVIEVFDLAPSGKITGSSVGKASFPVAKAVRSLFHQCILRMKSARNGLHVCSILGEASITCGKLHIDATFLNTPVNLRHIQFLPIKAIMQGQLIVEGTEGSSEVFLIPGLLVCLQVYFFPCV